MSKDFDKDAAELVKADKTRAEAYREAAKRLHDFADDTDKIYYQRLQWQAAALFLEKTAASLDRIAGK